MDKFSLVLLSGIIGSICCGETQASTSQDEAIDYAAGRQGRLTQVVPDVVQVPNYVIQDGQNQVWQRIGFIPFGGADFGDYVRVSPPSGKRPFCDLFEDDPRPKRLKTRKGTLRYHRSKDDSDSSYS